MIVLPVVFLFFALGILFASHIASGFPVIFPAFLAAGFLILGAIAIFRKNKLAPIAILISCFFSGMISKKSFIGQNQSGFSVDIIKLIATGDIVFKGSIDSFPQINPHGFSALVKIKEVILSENVFSSKREIKNFPNRIKIFFNKDTGHLPCEGDIVLLKNLKQISFHSMRNPDIPLPEFKFKYPAFSVSKGDFIFTGKESPGPVQFVRNRLLSLLDRSFSKETSIFIQTIVAGTTTDISRQQVEIFRKSGLAHLLAISGLHLSIIALLILKVLRFVFARIPSITTHFPAKWISIIVSIPLIWVYAIFTSLKPPVTRSAIMITLAHISFMSCRNSSGLLPICFAGLIILILSPDSISDPSFLLSFSAITGIVLLSEKILNAFTNRFLILKNDYFDTIYTSKFKRVLIRIFRGVLSLFSVTVSASVATLPVSCLFFEKIPVSGLIANLIAVPIFSSFILPLDFIYCIFLTIAGKSPHLLNTTIDLINRIFLFFAELFSRWDTLNVSTGVALISFILLISAIILLTKKKKIACLLFVFATLILFAPATLRFLRNRIHTGGKLTAIFPEVGQGDAIFLITPQKKHILVDTGPLPGDEISTLVKKFADSKLDLLVISHGHSDHYGGAIRLVEDGVKIEELWINPQGIIEKIDEDYLELIEKIKSNGTRIVIGPKCKTKNVWGISIEVLQPCDPEGYDPLLDWNNNSIVLYIKYGSAGMLLTGDIEFEGEEKLRQWSAMRKVDILKIPHHGSGGASGNVITGWKGLKLGIITAGYNNRFGFPHKRVLREFESKGIDIFRVDRDGAWILISDGKRLDVRNYKWERIKTFNVLN